MSMCPDCSQPVTPMITLTGRHVDLEPATHPDGNWTTTITDQGEIRAHALTSADLPAENARRHHRCPPTPEPGPNCFHCGNPMPRAIATLLKWTEHPACDPEFVDQIATEYQIARARQFRAGRRKKR